MIIIVSTLLPLFLSLPLSQGFPPSKKTNSLTTCCILCSFPSLSRFIVDVIGFNIINGTWESSTFENPKLYINSVEQVNFLESSNFISNDASFTVTPFYSNSLSNITFVHGYSIHYYHSTIHIEILIHFLYSDSVNSVVCKNAGTVPL